jgi:hypothetical protein
MLRLRGRSSSEFLISPLSTPNDLGLCLWRSVNRCGADTFGPCHNKAVGESGIDERCIRAYETCGEGERLPDTVISAPE